MFCREQALASPLLVVGLGQTAGLQLRAEPREQMLTLIL